MSRMSCTPYRLFQAVTKINGALLIVLGCVTDATTVEFVMTRRGIVSVHRDLRDQTASEVSCHPDEMERRVQEIRQGIA